MTDREIPSVYALNSAVLRRADSKVFLAAIPVPCMIALIMQKGESTDMDMLLLTEDYRNQGIHVVIMDITEDCLDSGEERKRHNVRDLLQMQQKYEASIKEDAALSYMLPEEENGNMEPGETS